MSTPDYRRSAVSYPSRCTGRHIGADIILSAVQMNPPAWMRPPSRSTSTGMTGSCAVSSTRATLHPCGCPPCDPDTAERCFRQVLQTSHPRIPLVITDDKHAASAPAFETLRQERRHPETCQLRPGAYRSRVVEQDHRYVKCRVNHDLGCGRGSTVQRTVHGNDARHRLRTGPLEGMATRNVCA
jgi:hypothetical protein